MDNIEKRKIEKYLIDKYGSDNVVKTTLFPGFVEMVVFEHDYAKRIRGWIQDGEIKTIEIK